MHLSRLARVAAAVAIVCTAAGTAQADETAFLARFHGNWEGSGSIVRNAQPMPVSCRVVGEPGANRIHIQGRCTISLLSRGLLAQLFYNPTNGVYSGVYTGAKVGPADLSGRRKGDFVYLTVTWPAPVNGDTSATMIIENAGRGLLKISITDNATKGGLMLRTDFHFSQL